MDDEWDRNANVPQRHPGDEDRWSPIRTTRTPVFRRRTENDQVPPPQSQSQRQQLQQRRPSQTHSQSSQQYPSWGPPPTFHQHQHHQQQHSTRGGGGQYPPYNSVATSQPQQQQPRSYSPIPHRHYSPPHQSQQGGHQPPPPPPPSESLHRQHSYQQQHSYSPDPYHHHYSQRNPRASPNYNYYGSAPPQPSHHASPSYASAVQSHHHPQHPPYPPHQPHPGATSASSSYPVHQEIFSPPQYNFEPPQQRVSYDTTTPSPPRVEAPELPPPPPQIGPPMHNGAPPEYVYLSEGAPRDEELIFDIKEDDVLCGRGAPTTYHPGNQFFKDLVTKYQPSYIASRRSDKPQIASQLVQIIRQRGGRFLKRAKKTGPGPSGHFCWEDVGDQRAYEKACQALRENAPEIRRRIASQELAAISVDSEQQSAAPVRVSDESRKRSNEGGSSSSPECHDDYERERSNEVDRRKRRKSAI